MFGLKYLYSLVLIEDKERTEIIQDGRRSKRGSRRMPGSPSLMNTSEPQLHIEWLPLKSTWGPAEQWLSNPGCKERSMQSWGGGRTSNLLRTCTHRWGTQGRGRYHGRRDPPCGTRTLNRVSGTSALGPDMGKMSPLGWLENQWGLLRAVRDWDSTLKEVMHRSASSQWQHRGNWLQNAWGPPQGAPQPTPGSGSSPSCSGGAGRL